MTSCVSSSESKPQNRGPLPANADFIETLEGCCTACCTYYRHLMARNDNLLAVAVAWPHLPEHVRQVIVTLAEAATQRDAAKE